MTTPTKAPVVFVHGLWLHSSSWQPWVDKFAAAGYSASTSDWPGDGATVEASRGNPKAIAGHGVNDVVNAYAKYIATLPAKPIVIGHSFGGLITQRLLGEGHAVAGVAIDPAPIKGILNLPPSALRVASVALRNPLNRNGAVSLSKAQFRYGFANAISAAESDELYDKWTVPSPGKPLFEAAFAAFSPKSPVAVQLKNNDRGPLLITAGGDDHTVPPSISHTTKKLYRHSSAVTEVLDLPGHGHSLTIDSGWEKVADAVLEWLGKQGF